MLVPARIYRSQSARSPMALTQQTRFQGLTKEQVKLWDSYEKMSKMTPYELITALEKILETSYMEMLDAVPWIKDKVSASGSINWETLKSYQSYRRSQPELGQEFLSTEFTLLEKINGGAYRNKSGNTARELKAYLQTLTFYSPQNHCLMALVKQMIAETDSNVSRMP